MLKDIQQQIASMGEQVIQLYESGQHQQAIKVASAAYDIARQHLGEDDPYVATTLDNLAGLYYGMGDYAAVEPLYQQVLELQCRVLGEGHPPLAISLNNLAEVYHAMGKYSPAEPLHRRALDIRRTPARFSGADGPGPTVAWLP